MNLEHKILEPIYIDLRENLNIRVNYEDKKYQHLNSEAILNAGHYGFILVKEDKGKQSQMIYPTQCQIESVKIEDGIVNVFEANKNNAWIFDINGNLQHVSFNKLGDEEIISFDKEDRTYDLMMKEPQLKEPLTVQISKDSKRSVLMKTDPSQPDSPLYPGVMFGGIHYGFQIVFEDLPEKKVVYPTQNTIVGIGIEGNLDSGIKVYETEKYFPWHFTNDGELLSSASYNLYSQSDLKSIVDEINFSRKK